MDIFSFFLLSGYFRQYSIVIHFELSNKRTHFTNFYCKSFIKTDLENKILQHFGNSNVDTIEYSVDYLTPKFSTKLLKDNVHTFGIVVQLYSIEALDECECLSLNQSFMDSLKAYDKNPIVFLTQN